MTDERISEEELKHLFETYGFALDADAKRILRLIAEIRRLWKERDEDKETIKQSIELIGQLGIALADKDVKCDLPPNVAYLFSKLKKPKGASDE